MEPVPIIETPEIIMMSSLTGYFLYCFALNFRILLCFHSSDLSTKK